MVEWEFPLLLEVRRKRVREGKQNTIKRKENKKKTKEGKGGNVMQCKLRRVTSARTFYLLFVFVFVLCVVCCDLMYERTVALEANN